MSGLIIPAPGGFPENLVAPYHPLLATSVQTNTINTLFGCRVVVPKSGQLRDLAVYVGTQSGNIIGAVYDTGDALAASRTKLWDSGSVAVGSANAWQVIGDPNVAVTKGQQLDLMVATDNATAAFGRATLIAGGQATLPSGFFAPTGGATGKLAFRVSPGSFTAPSTVAEGSVAAIGSQFLIMARIS